MTVKDTINAELIKFGSTFVNFGLIYFFNIYCMQEQIQDAIRNAVIISLFEGENRNEN